MKTYLVTGAAGFIGANYIKYILAKHSDVKVVILDALTYAGNLGTIAKDIDNERCFFIKGDICSREVVDGFRQLCPITDPTPELSLSVPDLFQTFSPETMRSQSKFLPSYNEYLT